MEDKTKRFSSTGPTQDSKAHKAEDKAHRPGSARMFDGIAARYDFLNVLLSMGLDRRWRDLAQISLGLSDGMRVLDLATGTGDLAVSVLRNNSCVQLIGVDPSETMLFLARKKIEKKGLHAYLLRADGSDLPFSSGSFDAVCMAFGIRNFPDRKAALNEIARVLRPGGKLSILELSYPERGMIGFLSGFWLRWVVPGLGALVSRAEAYRYLEKSIAEFPSPDLFVKHLESSGFSAVNARLLSFGLCCLYCARR